MSSRSRRSCVKSRSSCVGHKDLDGRLTLQKPGWTKDEVIDLVQKYGMKRWSLIAKHLHSRNGKQCRERWHNHLNPTAHSLSSVNDHSSCTSSDQSVCGRHGNHAHLCSVCVPASSSSGYDSSLSMCELPAPVEVMEDAETWSLHPKEVTSSLSTCLYRVDTDPSVINLSRSYVSVCWRSMNLTWDSQQSSSSSEVQGGESAELHPAGPDSIQLHLGGHQRGSSTTSEVQTESSTTFEVKEESSTTSEVQTESSTTSEVQTESSTTSEVQTEFSTTSEVQRDSNTTSEVQTESSTTLQVLKGSSTTTEVQTESSTTSEVQEESSTTSEVQEESSSVQQQVQRAVLSCDELGCFPLEGQMDVWWRQQPVGFQHSPECPAYQLNPFE
ncbi:Myb-related protein A, partial [Larimichthys crocea]